ncbi:MAG: HAD hydrolase-like protein, partial [Clostridia bacterium]|nr:HAD hydrolase-like protein [Clostridia bacterium]
LESCGITDNSRVLMVGDREHDVLGAKENGLACMGVLFGYGDLPELESAGAAYIAETVPEIAQLILAEDDK